MVRGPFYWGGGVVTILQARIEYLFFITFNAPSCLLIPIAISTVST